MQETVLFTLLTVCETMRGQISLCLFVEVLTVAEIYLVGEVIVHFSFEGGGVPTEYANLLSFRVVENPVNRVVFRFDRHDELGACVRVDSQNVEKVSELITTVERFG